MLWHRSTRPPGGDSAAGRHGERASGGHVEVKPGNNSPGNNSPGNDSLLDAAAMVWIAEALAFVGVNHHQCGDVQAAQPAPSLEGLRRRALAEAAARAGQEDEAIEGGKGGGGRRCTG